jgi:hypothetical protein
VPNEVVVPFAQEGATVYLYDANYATNTAVGPTSGIAKGTYVLGTSNDFTNYFAWTVHYNGTSGAVTSSNNLMPNYTFMLYAQFTGNTYTMQNSVASAIVPTQTLLTPNYLVSNPPWSTANNFTTQGLQVGQMVTLQLANLSSNLFNLYVSSPNASGFIHSKGLPDGEGVSYYIETNDSANTAPTDRSANGRSAFVYYTSPL